MTYLIGILLKDSRTRALALGGTVVARLCLEVAEGLQVKVLNLLQRQAGSMLWGQAHLFSQLRVWMNKMVSKVICPFLVNFCPSTVVPTRLEVSLLGPDWSWGDIGGREKGSDGTMVHFTQFVYHRGGKILDNRIQ